ncbi:hypothetical protein FZI91_05820 [Mycobacterium sp. CBMA271]|uniref:hypothetical protein n=1 Tax=unclassified Mycobacteroides TaxID=2618759 RepID=UPI0012DE4836|nr:MULTISPECIES: hypothetical protein [unclassified Mycobacteroides]MUM15320.1 hypothetical protein [Mycobacteroides sp. CBMA 326]MUM21221.1 hypothetical protein [Mycobacteroides sp. CBMA 271]
MTAVWAFRSTCDATGCVATGAVLDETNHAIAGPSGNTAQMRYIDGSWRRLPVRKRDKPLAGCLQAPNGINDADTIVGTWELAPQPYSILRGTMTNTAGDR